MKLLTAVFSWLLALVLSSLQPAAQPTDRFDMLVRADFFAGFGGDAARLARGMETCSKVLQEHPRHAEALVWHGSGLLYQAGAAFAANDRARGSELWTKGIEEMDTAVTLAPDDPGVLVPRGAVLLQATRNMPAAMGRPLLESAVKNYERALDVQKERFESMGDHPRGELLFGIADGYARLGDAAAARRYFERLVQDVPGSGQAPRARAYLATGETPVINGLACVGCHR
jgi:tetratricopeptide (TPR) repeat protein